MAQRQLHTADFAGAAPKGLTVCASSTVRVGSSSTKTTFTPAACSRRTMATTAEVVWLASGRMTTSYAAPPRFASPCAAVTFLD